MFDRVISLIGSDKFKKINESTVLVVGLGGVGGYAVESLVRSGIGKIVLIDYDKIDDSNLNRQIITNRSNIGEYKTNEWKTRIKSINPDCEVIIYNMFLDKDNIAQISDLEIDYIIDACDSVDTKKLLIDYSFDKNIKLISSMGTAKKINPSKLEIMDIRKTSYDPLAKIIRKYVLSLKTNKKVMVVSSVEKPRECQGLASMVFVPASAGILLANYVVRDIIGE
ncbi:MAG: ThiF family adenylyltransferase [bacterium]|nr:ThiF family adenylyltransferase [bacterium]